MSPTKPAVFSRAGPALLLMLLTVAPLQVAADESPPNREIEVLKEQIRDLQARVERLEQQTRQGAKADQATPVPVPGGWRKAANWRLLTKGMTDYQVKEILGEPDADKTVKKFEFWEYGDGRARLYLRRLKSWDIPTGIDPQ